MANRIITYKGKEPKATKDDQSNIFMDKVDSNALQLLAERQREKMASLEVHEAATMGDYDSLEDYISSGRFDINMKDPEWQDKTPLHWACGRGFVECVRLLLQNGAKGTSRMVMGWTPSHCAAETGKLNVLRALHTADVPIDRKDDYGATPRRIAETYGHWECVKFLKLAEQEQADKRQSGRLDESALSDSDNSYDEDSQSDKS